jgi:hypothetical protein
MMCICFPTKVEDFEGEDSWEIFYQRQQQSNALMVGLKKPDWT